jgi:acetyl/propionyl-CoA carboxylase alpha subunit
MFEKLLIADRGEIVLRIARTCERVGITSIAVHTGAEAGAPHVLACDEHVSLGEESARDAYTDVGAIIAAARASGAQAIHPGCGPLCCDPRLAHAALEAGLVLVGAPAEILERFAHPLLSRELARFAGVRPLPTSPVEAASAGTALEQALEVGYPLRVKALLQTDIAELVESEDELPEAFERCRARVREACGDERVFLEHWLDCPRILSVQVVGDGHDCAALGDLERSLEQPTHTLLEESPAPALAALPGGGSSKRQTLCDAAVRVAKDGALVGAATVDFLLDAGGRLHFTRVRPGLPLEHALVEMCAKIDLVEIQLRIASGESLPAEARRAQPTGHAIEARIYAEDPYSGAVSDPVEITALRWPMVAPGCLRVETDLAVGSRVATDLDPLVAKVAAYGQTRHQALLTLDRVLAEATIDPLATNLPFVREILSDESYRAGQYDNGFAERLLSEIKTRS